MYRKSPGIRKNKILEYLKKAAAILGISDPSCFTGHALCAKNCTSIANATDLNIQEKISAARHGSVNALVGYIQPTAKSECRKLEALGYKVEEEKTLSKEEMKEDQKPSSSFLRIKSKELKKEEEEKVKTYVYLLITLC